MYFALGERLELHWLRDRIIDLPRETRWEAMARAALRDDVYAEQAELTAHVLRSGTGAELWPAENARGRALAAGAGGHPLRRRARSGAALVAVRELRNLIHSSGTRDPAAQPVAD